MSEEAINQSQGNDHHVPVTCQVIAFRPRHAPSPSDPNGDPFTAAERSAIRAMLADFAKLKRPNVGCPVMDSVLNG